MSMSAEQQIQLHWSLFVLIEQVSIRFESSSPNLTKYSGTRTTQIPLKSIGEKFGNVFSGLWKAPTAAKGLHIAKKHTWGTLC